MASIKFKLKSKEYANGEYPIVLQIIKNRKVKVISLGFFGKPQTWDSKEGLFKTSHSNATILYTKLEKIKLKARLILLEFEVEDINFTLEEFESKFRTTSNESLSVFEYWKEIIAEMESTGRFGNADVNKDTERSLKKLNGSDKLSFSQITMYYLEKYEVFLRTNVGTNGGIGVKMKAIRALYNSEIRRGFVKKSRYPFVDYKISKLKSSPIKRALPIDFIRKIESLEGLKSNMLTNARNYFLFSFYTRGMNFTDMALLKWNDISENRIIYKRNKTNVNFNIKILPPIQEILDYYQANGNLTNYIIPILYRED